MFIYKIKNHINNFVYIGMTTRSVEQRWTEHLKKAETEEGRLYRAMRKHGINNFYVETVATLEELSSVDLLFIIEKQYIKEHNSYWFGYNNTIGGKGYKYNRPKRGRKKKA